MSEPQNKQMCVRNNQLQFSANEMIISSRRCSQTAMHIRENGATCVVPLIEAAMKLHFMCFPLCI